MTTDIAQLDYKNNIFTSDGTGTDIDDNSTGGGTLMEDYNNFYNFSVNNESGVNNLTVDPRLNSQYVPRNKDVANGGYLGSWMDADSGLIRYGSGPPIGAKEMPETQFKPRIGPPFSPVIGWDYYTP